MKADIRRFAQNQTSGALDQSDLRSFGPISPAEALIQINPRDAFPDVADEFIWKTAGKCTQFINRNLLFSVFSKQCYLIEQLGRDLPTAAGKVKNAESEDALLAAMREDSGRA